MNIDSGNTMSWPEEAFRVEKSDLLLMVGEMSLIRLNEGSSLIGITSTSSEALDLKLKAIKPAEICFSPKTNLNQVRQNTEKLISALISRLPSEFKKDIRDIEATNLDKKEKILEERLVDSIAKMKTAYLNQSNALLLGYEPLNSTSTYQLLLQMYEDTKILRPASRESFGKRGTPNEVVDSLWECIKILNPTAEKPVKISETDETNGTNNISHYFECANLISRDIVLNTNSLKHDCGDLIAFEENTGDAVLLRSVKGKYKIWSPKVKLIGCCIDECKEIIDTLNPRAISITPTFQDRDLTTTGLLRFTYGEPKNTTQYVISGLIIGIILGFILSIAREVGAIRWVFGLGITGGLTGFAIGILAGGFQFAATISLIVTLLALMIPSFNTIITNEALPDKDLGLLIQASSLLIAAGMVRVILNWTQTRSLLATQQKGAAKAQMAAMNRLLKLPIDFFRSRTIGELQLRFSSLDELRDEIQTLLEGGVFQLVLTSIYILFMLKISIKLTILAILIAILIIFPTAVLGLQSRPLQRRQEEEEAEARSRNLELFGSVSKLRVAGAEAAAAKWWANKYREVTFLENKLDILEASARLLQSILPNLGTLLIYILIAKLTSESLSNPSIQSPNIGALLGFFAAFGTFIGATAGFAQLAIGAFDIPIVYERAKVIFETKTEGDESKSNSDNLQGNITLDRISYRYSDDLPLVLDKVSMDIKAGEYIAIVGPSGSGKSTLVRLLLAFATPEDGSILLDGQPLSGLKPNSVRRQIGTVMQSSTLFSGSLIEAIAGGAVIREEDAWYAAELAGLGDDIRSMPMGLQTIVSEGGGTLSGGQQQRVAIARALVRKPKILILDEATSALDNRTQSIVSNSLDDLAVTRIVIAHRLSTIRNADRIYVLNKGQIVEEGSFDVLINKKGLFEQLMSRQMS